MGTGPAYDPYTICWLNPDGFTFSGLKAHFDAVVWVYHDSGYFMPFVDYLGHF